MGKAITDFVEGSRIYSCKKCGRQLASRYDVISKNFRGKTGNACLIEEGINYKVGPIIERGLSTGVHLVQDIYCKGCNTRLGWKYIKAYKQSEKYKEGKIVLEKSIFCKRKWHKL